MPAIILRVAPSLIILFLMVGPSGAATLSMTDDEDGVQTILDHWYIEVCPYGEAVVTDMTKSVIATTSCVNYDYRTGKFVTWVGAVNSKHNFKYYEPSKVRVFVVDGELILTKDKFPKVVEYGAMTITDPRFPEWIKTH